MPHIIKKDGLIPVIVVTLHKGVIFGYSSPSQDLSERSLSLTGAKLAIEWGTTKGLSQLAATGPTEKSLISAEADAAIIHDIIKVLHVTEKAEYEWKKY